MPKETIEFANEQANEYLSKIELDTDNNQITLTTRNSAFAEEIHWLLQRCIKLSKDYDEASRFPYNPSNMNLNYDGGSTEIIIEDDLGRALNILFITGNYIDANTYIQLRNQLSEPSFVNSNTMHPH